MTNTLPNFKEIITRLQSTKEILSRVNTKLPAHIRIDGSVDNINESISSLENAIKIIEVRSLTEEDLKELNVYWHEQYDVDIVSYYSDNIRNKDIKFFNIFSNIIDCLLISPSAENVIGDLEEMYLLRLRKGRAHARRWLLAQLIWISYGRALDLMSQFVKARAGK